MSNDYNNGQWWGWNGGECPVDPRSRVEGIEAAGTKWEAAACQNEWRTFRGAFRVTKPAPPKPREWWLILRRGWVVGTSREMPRELPSDEEAVLVVEKLPK